VTRSAFGVHRGLSIRFYARLSSATTTSAAAFGGLKARIPADGRPLLAAGVELFGLQRQRRFHVNEGVVYADGGLDENWHLYAIEIGSDGFVDFYVDTVLVHRSTERLDPKHHGHPVTVGGKSPDGAVRFDGVLVAGSDPLQSVDFAEGFTGPLASWQAGSTGGTVPPVNDPYLHGHPSPAFNPGGGTVGVGEAVTSGTFDFTSGLTVRADLFMPDLSTPDLAAWFGLQTSTGFSGLRDLAAGVYQDATPGVDRTRYYVNDLLVFEEALQTGWHSFRTVIRTDRRVEFFRDGLLVHRSASQVSLAYNPAPVKVGGKAWGGSARVDNVAVLTPCRPWTPEWVALSPSGPGPGGARLASIHVDETRQRFVGFGGGSLAGAPNANAWALPSVTLDPWVALSPGGSPPPAREGHASVFDAARERLLVIGGRGTAGILLQDSWILDFSSTLDGAWSDLAPSSPPAPRWMTGAVLDAGHRRAVLFGGAGTGSARFGDVHALGLDTGAWTALSPASPGPASRAGHTCVMDTAHRRMIVFGGEDGTGPLADVWSLDLSHSGGEDWAMLTPAGPSAPSARSGHAAVYDPHTRRMILFGGIDGTATELNDLWLLDLADGADGRWVRLDPTGAAPVGRWGAAVTFTPAGRRMVLFGGEDAAQLPLGDLLALDFP
jgi:hypothetical protein